MILDLDAITRNEIASMVYSRWVVAYENYKDVKNMQWDKSCPKAEWPQFHAHMLASAQKELDLATKLKADICSFSPLVKGE
jgi:hypothetical protein